MSDTSIPTPDDGLIIASAFHAAGSEEQFRELQKWGADHMTPTEMESFNTLTAGPAATVESARMATRHAMEARQRRGIEYLPSAGPIATKQHLEQAVRQASRARQDGHPNLALEQRIAQANLNIFHT